jgi:nicotinate-nucleotide--dimethylbenzimidazole phosphoribosyltransferase
MRWLEEAIKPVSEEFHKVALARQAQLTKPAGSLGQLETVAVRLASLLGCVKPQLETVQITIFAADHGVVVEGVSAFPQSVTQAMLANFIGGGAAISVLAKEQSARLEVVDVGVKGGSSSLANVVQASVAEGTANFVKQAAMSLAQQDLALTVGRDAVDRAVAAGAVLFVGGEMGIGNTTSASALASALLNQPIVQLVGPGTGVDKAGQLRKQQVIEQALILHKNSLNTPLSILQHLGGFEIAALVGSYLRCGQKGLPVIVDGFIATVAALLAVKIAPELKAWLFYGHQSQEPGHKRVLDTLGEQPLLSLNMRLGEGSGAALAISLLRSACQLHNNMATFEEVGI